MNVPSLKDLIDFHLRNPSASQLLAEYAERAYENFTQPIENTVSLEKLCSEGWMTKEGVQYVFSSPNTFEWFWRYNSQNKTLTHQRNLSDN
jgi:hypothetical protein